MNVSRPCHTQPCLSLPRLTAPIQAAPCLVSEDYFKVVFGREVNRLSFKIYSFLSKKVYPQSVDAILQNPTRPD
jgi:hypothetical protein